MTRLLPATTVILIAINVILCLLVVYLLAYPACERAARGYTWRLNAASRRCEVAVSVGVSNVIWVQVR